jgi:hypothetical protein
MSKSAPVIPITFTVARGEEPVEAVLDFAQHEDVISTTRWRVPRMLDEGDLAMRFRAADARELAMLAAKRWRHYRTSATTAHSLDQLQQLIARDQEGEYCFHLKVTADWFPASLGEAMVRRTWCHHLMLDFMFVHPSISGRRVDVRGVGLSIFQSVCLIAKCLGCPLVWGEATKDSSTFYQKQLHRMVRDRFEIDSDEIDKLAAQFAPHLFPKGKFKLPLKPRTSKIKP